MHRVRGTVNTLGNSEAYSTKTVNVSLAGWNVVAKRISEIVPNHRQPCGLKRRMRIHTSLVIFLGCRRKPGMINLAANRANLPTRCGVRPLKIIDGTHIGVLV